MSVCFSILTKKVLELSASTIKFNGVLLFNAGIGS